MGSKKKRMNPNTKRGRVTVSGSAPEQGVPWVPWSTMEYHGVPSMKKGASNVLRRMSKGESECLA